MLGGSNPVEIRRPPGGRSTFEKLQIGGSRGPPLGLFYQTCYALPPRGEKSRNGPPARPDRRNHRKSHRFGAGTSQSRKRRKSGTFPPPENSPLGVESRNRKPGSFETPRVGQKRSGVASSSNRGSYHIPKTLLAKCLFLSLTWRMQILIVRLTPPCKGIAAPKQRA